MSDDNGDPGHGGDPDEWGAAAPDDGEPLAGDPRVQQGIDHLQRAAREMIAATRALLDVAEELVEDPHAAGDVGRFVASLAGQAQRWTGQAGRNGARSATEDPDDEPPVQRIPVS